MMQIFLFNWRFAFHLQSDSGQKKIVMKIEGEEVRNLGSNMYTLISNFPQFIWLSFSHFFFRVCLIVRFADRQRQDALEGNLALAGHSCLPSLFL